MEREEIWIEEEDEVPTFLVNRIIMEDIDAVVTKEELLCETMLDPKLSMLLEDVAKGRLSDQLKEAAYGKIFDELTMSDGIILKGKRVVVPKP